LSSVLLRAVFGVLLWPAAGALGWSLAADLWGLPWADSRLLALAGGAAAYAALHFFFRKPLFLYVMGHELTHALAAWVQGGEADHLHVSTKGGAVKVTRSNALVSLAPYFFPLYTFGVVLLYFVVDRRFLPGVFFLLGFTLAFHLALTAFSLREHQSDLAEVGWFFAFPLIAGVNCLVVAFVLGLCIPESPHFLPYLEASGGNLLRFSRWTASLFWRT
jgi:hypothetical protein